MKYDLIISDYDGTLGGSLTNQIDADTINAVNVFTAKGGKFVICTGRMLGGIRFIAQQSGFKGLIVSYQGACISDIESNEILLKGGICWQDCATILEQMRTENVPTVADIDDVMYFEHDNAYVDFHRSFAQVEKVDDLVKAVTDIKRTAFKLVGLGTPERVTELRDKYNGIYKGKYIFNSGGPNLLEIINPEFSKGNAVEFVANHYGVPLEKVMAVGDSTNDIELLSGNWHGVAVGDGAQALKKIAKEVTVPFKDKPIKTLIEKYCL